VLAIETTLVDDWTKVLGLVNIICLVCEIGKTLRVILLHLVWFHWSFKFVLFGKLCFM